MKITYRNKFCHRIILWQFKYFNYIHEWMLYIYTFSLPNVFIGDGKFYVIGINGYAILLIYWNN